MSEYKATTEDIREAWSWCAAWRDEMLPSSSDAEFDRWLKAHDSAVWAEGHADGITNSTEHRVGRKMTDPYATSTEQENKK